MWRSFTFFIKACCTHFGFMSHTKMTNLAKKERKRTHHSFNKVKKELNVLFQYIYLYIYISIYIYIYIYISLYIYIYWKKERNVLHSFAFFWKRTKRSRVLLRSLQKNETFSAFFYILCKKTMHSLRSFTF